MPRKKKETPSPSDEQKDIIRDSITDLFEQNDITVGEDIDAETLVFQKTPSTLTTQENNVLDKCKAKAERVMTTLLKLYLSDGFITKSEYVQAKVNMDSMTLGKIMNALGNLQRTFIELVKTQTNYIMNAENEYEKLSLDRDTTLNVSDSTTASEISNGYKSNNQKDLMRIIRSTIDDKK
jgi:hypothetical protein